MKRFHWVLFFCLLLLSSCIVRSPKYTSVDQVFSLKLNMKKSQVDSILAITPYSLKAKDDSETVYTYIYRTTERRTLPLLEHKTNGTRAKGKFMDLYVAYDNKSDRVTELKSKPSPKEEHGKYAIDVNSVFTLLTGVGPAILVYLGFEHK
jgi:hypothetical protein